MKQTLSRCEREYKYEVWNSYVYNEGTIRVNKIFLSFGKEEVSLILLTNNEGDLSDTDYLNEVIQLVHDMPIDFEVKTEFIDGNEENLENKIDEYKKEYLNLNN